MKNEPAITIYPHAEELAKVAAEDIIQALDQSFRAEKKFHIALSGGSTPRSIYEHLAAFPMRQAPLWKNVHFFWGDERCVPPDHPESNYRMAHEAFLSKIAVPMENIHRILGEESPEVEASRYAKEIQNHLPANKSGLSLFDWILLGVGSDGHTASLFPDARALQEQRRPCVLAEHPQTGQKRISLTLPLINNARRVSFFVTGKEKTLIVESILKKASSSSKYPAALVQPHHGLVEWYLDEAAAQKL
jgi:6-phosphogluconolactonase